MDKNIAYSVVIPVYSESETLKEIARRIFEAFRSIGKEAGFEIILVDDGSTDNSRQVIRELCNEKSYIKAVLLRKNFGKSFALTSGFLSAQGNFIITMDADLQDRPEDIPKLISKMDEGYDLVSGWKKSRKDGLTRIIGSRIFNRVVSFYSGLRLHDFNCGFKIYKAGIMKHIYLYGQNHRFIPLLAYFMGFKVGEIPISHDKRKYGSSKYPLFRYQGFFDLLSILFIYKYRFSPLYFFGILGLLLIVPSLAVIVFLAGRHVLYLLGYGERFILLNRPLISLATTFCLVGVNFFMTGFVCDFILHHIGASKTEEIVKSGIEEVL